MCDFDAAYERGLTHPYRDYIDAIAWSYGMTDDEAGQFFDEADNLVLEEILDGWLYQASIGFYCD